MGVGSVITKAQAWTVLWMLVDLLRRGKIKRVVYP